MTKIKKYWLIQGYDSLTLIYEKRVACGQLTDEQVKALLKALVAKAGLTFDEIIGAYAKRRTKIANDLLLVQRDGPSRYLPLEQIRTLWPSCAPRHSAPSAPLISKQAAAGACTIANGSPCTRRCSMLKTVFLALAVLPAVLLAADPAVTDGLSNGRAWTGMAVEIKFIYLLGVADGLRQATGELMPELSSTPGPEVEKRLPR
jgi:hypothetical protein